MKTLHGKSVKLQNLKLGIYFINSPLFSLCNVVFSLLPATYFLLSIRILPKKNFKKCKKTPIFITGTYCSKYKMKSGELRLD